MKKLLSMIAVMAMLLGLATVVGAGSSTDPTTFDTSVFVPAPYEDGCEGVECWEPIGLGIYHFWKDGIDCYHWLNKFETIPAVTEENGGCFTFANLAPATVVFWDGVPNLSKDLFKWWEGTTKDVYIPDSVTEIDEDAFVMNSTITLHFTANNAVALAYAETRGMAYKIVPRKHYDASIFVEPENLYEAGYDGLECADVHLGLYHLIPARNGGIGDYFHWTGTLEKMPDVIGDNGGCFTSATHAPATVIFWDGVPNLSKNLFKWAEGKTKDVYIPDSVTEIDEDAFAENSTITLHFTKNNEVALAYAEAHDMLYEILPDAPEPKSADPDVSETSEVSDASDVSEPVSDLEVIEPVSDVSDDVVLGDANGDGDVNMKDVLLIRKFIAKLDVSINEAATDLNADGSTDMKDVLLMRKQIAHVEA